ncbi:MAG TPA: FmdE family protein [Pyrinomonadaceae bacterium]|jgi:formylmethanofuran dehydrogenase subunit E|nr:FmdE family protein [Pyrinomonadaceae bacterium]
MQSLEEILIECERLHGHMCAGQLLGARMALMGCRLVGLDDPRGKDRRKTIVWVEIDRCMADAVSAAAGVRLGKRSLKYVDYGKVAATFLNTETNKAVRVVARESSRALADERFASIANKKERQFKAYSEATDEELFASEFVALELDEMDAPGSPRSRVICVVCKEGVNDGREVMRPDGSVVCRGCERGTYYKNLDNPRA